LKKILAVLLIIIFTLGSASVFAWNNEQDVLTLLAELEIIQGDTNGDYRLDDTVSRSECSKIVIALSEYRDSVAIGSSVSPFKDVPAAYWAAPYIQLAVNNGLIKGYTDATFRPDGTVLYEEAVTMLLKVLGYTDSDFGNSWPYGQVGIAKRIGLCDNADKSIGDELTRRDIMRLAYNLLNINKKGGTDDYITTLDYKIAEDVILIATSGEDSSVGSDKVFTSDGTYKINSKFNHDNVGRKGDLVIKENNEIAAFIPNEQTANRYSIYQVLNSEIVVYENGQLKSLEIDDNLSVYDKSTKKTLNSMITALSAGDELTVYSNNLGVPDYGIIKTDQLQGPYTFTGSGMLGSIGLSNASVTRNGSSASASDLQVNDIIYYSVPLNTIWSYSTKVTGVYEKATPNKDTPTSIQVSGETYTIESTAAFNKLSSNGSFKYGDTVILLLGKSNEVADVLSPSSAGAEVFGYLLETGTKEFTASDKSKYVNNYIKIASIDGNEYEYSADKNYDSLINSIVKVTFSDGVAKAAVINQKNPVSGTFNWTSKKLGNYNLSPDVNIIDIYTLDDNDVGLYTSVYPQRIDGVNLTAGSIVFVNKNEAGDISDLVLKDVTGDFYSFGIVKKAESVSGRMSSSGSYTYIIDGEIKSFNSNGKTFNIASGQPAKFIFTSSGQIDSIQALTQISGKISEITDSYIKADGIKYSLSDKTVVYRKDANYDYTVIPVSDIKDSDKYTLAAYYDKKPSSGGRVRIIIAAEK